MWITNKKKIMKTVFSSLLIRTKLLKRKDTVVNVLIEDHLTTKHSYPCQQDNIKIKPTSKHHTMCSVNNKKKEREDLVKSFSYGH